MAYDVNKDIVLNERQVVGDDLVVRLCQYDGGEKKIAIMKKIVSKHGEIYTSKVGRLDLTTTKVLAMKIVELLKEEQTT